jgi:exosortase
MRAQLGAVKTRGSIAGLAIVAAGICMFVVGSVGAEMFLSRISGMLIICGAIAFLYGFHVLRALLFPIALIMLVIPLPRLVISQIAFPLQLLASYVSEQLLALLRIPVLRDGNVITLANMTLGVVEACSGIRSIFSLLALAMLYGYFCERKAWIRIALALLSVPIAVSVNITRIVGTGILGQAIGSEAAEGFFHEFYGWLHFLAALGLLFAANWLLKRIARLYEQRQVAHVQ